MKWQLQYTTLGGQVGIAETPDVDASDASRLLSQCLRTLRNFPVEIRITNDQAPGFASIAPANLRRITPSSPA